MKTKQKAANGSFVALTDSAGDVAERYEGACPERSRRNAYGNVHVMDGNYNSRSSTLYDNPYTFTSRRRSEPMCKESAESVTRKVNKDNRKDTLCLSLLFCLVVMAYV